MDTHLVNIKTCMRMTHLLQDIYSQYLKVFIWEEREGNCSACFICNIFLLNILKI